MTVISFDSKKSVTDHGYFTFDDAAKKLKLKPRQLYRYRADGIIGKIYGQLWKGKPFPIVTKDDVDALIVIRKTPRKELIGMASTTNDIHLKVKITEWLNPFARSLARTLGNDKLR